MHLDGSNENKYATNHFLNKKLTVSYFWIFVFLRYILNQQQLLDTYKFSLSNTYLIVKMCPSVFDAIFVPLLLQKPSLSRFLWFFYGF